MYKGHLCVCVIVCVCCVNVCMLACMCAYFDAFYITTTDTATLLTIVNIVLVCNEYNSDLS